jgi:hypothetical protein
MGYTVSKAGKNALVVGGINLLANLVGTGPPDVTTLYRVAVAAGLAALVSYERGGRIADGSATTAPATSSAILDLLPGWVDRRRKPSG